MNVKQALALSILAFAGSAALADDPTLVNDTFMSTKDRAAVRSEVLTAGVEGRLIGGGELLTMRAPMARPTSGLSREAVRALWSASDDGSAVAPRRHGSG